MTKVIASPNSEDSLNHILSIISLGDAMKVALNMELPVYDFARINIALLTIHGMMERKYYTCIRRDGDVHAPKETPIIVCNVCLMNIPVDEDMPESEFVLIDKESLKFDGLECEICGY